MYEKSHRSNSVLHCDSSKLSRMRSYTSNAILMSNTILVSTLLNGSDCRNNATSAIISAYTVSVVTSSAFS